MKFLSPKSLWQRRYVPGLEKFAEYQYDDFTTSICGIPQLFRDFLTDANQSEGLFYAINSFASLQTVFAVFEDIGDFVLFIL